MTDRKIRNDSHCKYSYRAWTGIWKSTVTWHGQGYGKVQLCGMDMDMNN